MKKLRNLVLGAVTVLAVPVLATAVTLESNFSGSAQHDGDAPGDYTNGTLYTAYLILDTTQENPWYPYDQTNKEYTAVITAPIDSYFGGQFQTVTFSEQTVVSVYEDDIAGGTAADFANTATFTDGTEILSGDANTMIGTRFDSFGLPYEVSGTIVFTGGAGIGNLDAQCAGGILMNDFINFQIGSFPPGFQEDYDAQWKCPDTTGNENSTWGSVKSQYR